MLYKQTIDIVIKEEFRGSVSWTDNKVSDQDRMIQSTFQPDGLVLSYWEEMIDEYTMRMHIIFRDQAAYDYICSLSLYNRPAAFEYQNNILEEI